MSRPLKYTLFNRRLQAWTLACILLCAQLWGVWHSVAHAQTLQGVSATASVDGQLTAWGHEEDSSWICRALDHALAADLLVPGYLVDVATHHPVFEQRALPAGAPCLYESCYSARAPPALTA